ncbi:MAG: hypothetical protein Q7T88_12210 [Methylotenera sp.]|nr:hypothetical protein [Methylotenera sp.]
MSNAKVTVAWLFSLLALTIAQPSATAADSTGTLPDLGDPVANTDTVQPNINAQGAGFSYRENINGKLISITPQYSKQNGGAVGASLASPISPNMAAGILLTAGSDKNEWLLNAGFDLSSNQRFIFSLGQLRQKLDFNFISGNQKTQVRQDNIAASYQYLLGKDWLNAAEVNAYLSNTASITLGDKTYFTDTATLYELWSDPRRIAGGRVTGVQGRLVFTPTSKTTIKVGLGAERLTYDYLAGNESTNRATGSAELTQHLDNDFNFRASANAAASQSRYALGLGKSFKSGSQVGVDIAAIQGRDNTFNDNQLLLSYTQSFGDNNASAFGRSPLGMNNLALNNLDASGTPTNQASANTATSNSTTNTWTSSLVDQVSRRPSFLPAQVIAKIDNTATPTRLIAIDKSALPTGTSVANATGILTVPIGLAVSGIASVTLNGSAFSNSGQFGLSNTISLIINPNRITQPAVGVVDTYVVTMNNSSGGGTTLATVTVSHGSTKIDSVVISSGVLVVSTAAITGLTAPVAGAAPVTTVTATAGYTGTVAWSPAVSGTFADNTIYTATVTLTPASGYTFTGVAVNFFTASGATATNPINSGVVSATFPATVASLPAGYVTNGGLTWAPITTTAIWDTASATCSISTALGFIAGTWRQPDTTELSALYATRNSGVTPAGWGPIGWSLGGTSSSTSRVGGQHDIVYLNGGSVDSAFNSTPLYVSCVH